MFVNAGSRHEDLETTGSAFLLEKMFLRGTSSKSKSDISNEIESMGAKYNAETGREISSFGLNVFKGDVTRAVRILGDLISNS